MAQESSKKRHSGGFDHLTRLGEITRLSQSTPSSPRLLPRRARDVAGASTRASLTGLVTRPDSLDSFDASASGTKEINWKERCLELQLELHRNRTQATRTRDMLREKMLWAYTFILVAITIILLYAYSTRKFKYWQKRNVPFLKPIPFFGNFWPIVKMQQPLGQWLMERCREMDKDYFGIFVFDKPVLVVQSPKLIKQVLQKDFAHFQNRAAACPKNNPIMSSIMFFTNNPKWKAERNHLSPVFSTGKLKLMFAHILKETSAMTDYINGFANVSNVESKEICTKYSTNVIAKCAFGVDAKSFENEEAEFRELGRRIFDFRYSTALRQFFCLVFPNLVDLFNVGFVDEYTCARLKSIFLEVYDCRITSKNLKGSDLVDILIETTKNLSTFDENALIGQALQFFLAGYETTGSIFSFTLYELCVNEEAQDRLRAEILETLEKYDNCITYESIFEMEYLDMCVSETLRKYPVFPFLDRMTTSAYKIDDNLVIEEGIPIYIPLFGLHYNPEIYPEPGKYDPERFRDKSQINKDSLSYIPFGEGPRICIGMRFGLLGVKLGLVSVLSKFKLDATDRTPIPLKFACKSVILQPVGGIPLKFVPLDER